MVIKRNADLRLDVTNYLTLPKVYDQFYIFLIRIFEM